MWAQYGGDVGTLAIMGGLSIGGVSGYTAAMKKMGLTAAETAAVGDQLFTDVWGANHSRIKMLFVEPMEPEPRSKRFIRFKRVLEKPFLPRKFVDDKKE